MIKSSFYDRSRAYLETGAFAMASIAGTGSPPYYPASSGASRVQGASPARLPLTSHQIACYQADTPWASNACALLADAVSVILSPQHQAYREERARTLSR